MVAEMLRILEQFDLMALGHNSPEYIRVVAEAMKIATRDKDACISDPRFVAPPLDRRLSDAYARSCAAAIVTRVGEAAEDPSWHAHHVAGAAGDLAILAVRPPAERSTRPCRS